ncbi:MAG: 2-isopropylmalate synthase [Firmicutes bacterium]|nr:2-isopropylmalate synthase [Bacillota bacterium]
MGTFLQRERREKFPLVNVTEPQYRRDLFPYSGVPKITFDGKDVPIDPPEEIFITCTTFRDGQQARPPYTVKQIVDLFDLIHRLGGPNGVIRQSEFFLYTEKDRESVEKCMERGYRFPEITSWIRASEKDFQLVKQMGIKETGILTSCSDYHIFSKLGSDRKGTMEGYLDLVRKAIEAGVKPRCHLEDLTKADIYGFVIPYVQELMAIAEDSGVGVKVRMCDTLGYGISYPGSALPRSVPRLVHTLIHDGGVPKEQLEWHGHNDFHKGLINATTAWLYGCAALNGTLLGLGERTGNTPIEGLIFEYIGLMGGDENGINTNVVTEIAEYYEKELGYKVPANYPFCGEDFNLTRAGIHADGVIKNEEIYNIFDTVKFLKRPIKVGITDKSGAAGMAYWLNAYLGLTGDKKIDKRDPGILKILEWVDAQYNAGRTTAISDEEILAVMKERAPQFFKA